MYFVVCGKADMLVLVDLFYCPIECGAQAVGGIAATLGNTNAWCATLGVGSVDCQTFLIAGVVFGQAGSFVLCEGNAVVEEQVITIAQLPERLLNVLLPGIFFCLRYSRGSGGMMVLLSSICSAGPLM